MKHKSSYYTILLLAAIIGCVLRFCESHRRNLTHRAFRAHRATFPPISWRAGGFFALCSLP